MINLFKRETRTMAGIGKHRILFFRLLMLVSMTRLVISELVVIPKDAEIEENGTLVLECVSSNNMIVKWKHCSADGSECNHINYGSNLEHNYKQRFTLDSSCSTGKCDLTIRNVQMQDVGEYCCGDRGGKGEIKCAQLTVIQGVECQNDAPDGAISGTSCDIPSDKVQHTCRVSFRGARPPVIVWEDVSGNIIGHETIGQQSQSESGQIVESRISQEAATSHRRNGAHCRTIYSKAACSSVYDTYQAYDSSVSTDMFKGSVVCTANASGPCSFTWFKTDDPQFIVENSLLNFTSGSLKSGKYTCSANCSIKSLFCVVSGTTVNFIEGTLTDLTGSGVPWLIVSASVACGVVLAVVLLVACLLCLPEDRRRKMLKKLMELNSLRELAYAICCKATSPPGNISEENRRLSGEGDEGLIESDSDDSTDFTYGSVPKDNATIWKVPIRGIALINARMYYVCKRQRMVEVYDLRRSEKLEAVLVPNMESPWCLVKSRNNRFLYVSEYDNTDGAYVYKIDLSENDGTTHSRFQVSNEFNNNWVRVSVAGNNSLVVCGFRSSKIEIYGQNDIRIEAVELHSSATHLQKAMLLNQKQIAYIHGWGEDKDHRVCIANRQSPQRIEKFYGSGKKDLFKPTDIVVSTSGLICVADFTNNRVLVLNPDLTLKYKIRSSTNYKSNPCRLFIDDTEEYLYVGEDSGNISRLRLDQLS